MKTAKFNGVCWIWPYAKNSDGYGIFQKANKTLQAHKWLWEELKRKTPANCELDHLCKNKLCINPEHLEPVSHAENCRRAKQSKLTNADVKEIRSMAGKHAQRVIAQKFGVSRASIGYILQGKRWI